MLKILFSLLCLSCTPNLFALKSGQKNVAYCLQAHYQYNKIIFTEYSNYDGIQTTHVYIKIRFFN